ncbi:hypothetical protein OHA19_40945 (plasmid) [Streptomyces sp. NBC_00012]|uniref:hypothetical protein n=1 Tax=Streptomyces sp. NBC_00012 TaxID=2975621 RepID=UPI002F915427
MELRPGTVLDGEAVIWRDGRFDFAAAQSRAASSVTRARALAARYPASYIFWDVLQHPDLGRLAPSRHPRLRRPCLLHPAATGPGPKRRGTGLSLYQVVRELQILLAVWTGACPTCHRNMPTPIPT